VTVSGRLQSFGMAHLLNWEVQELDGEPKGARTAETVKCLKNGAGEMDFFW
jgi:hypothetical protein